jgi:hypothetical protein
MSIRDHIASLEADGKLVRYAPKTRNPLRRRLFLTYDAIDDLENPRSAINGLRLKPYVLAAMTHWTAGGLVNAAGGKGRFMRRLDAPPPEIWEIRVTEQDVQSRLFSRFAEPDTLVLTKMHTRTLLGKKGSREWKTAMESCESAWAQLFQGITPFVVSSVHDYITENCDDFPL